MTTSVLAALATTVTTWPWEGVALLLLIVVLFAIAAVLANLGVGRPTAPDEQRDAIGPPGADDAVAENQPLHDV
jgi:hypothetical protein